MKREPVKVTSWRPDAVLPDGVAWEGNTLRFATKAEAEGVIYQQLKHRYREATAIETTDPVAHVWASYMRGGPRRVAYFVIEHRTRGIYTGFDFTERSAGPVPRFRWSITRSEGQRFYSHERAAVEMKKIETFVKGCTISPIPR